jgi:hypothetical protein
MTTQPQANTNSETGASGSVNKDIVKRVIRMFELLAKPDELPVAGLSMGEKTQKR